MKVALCHKFCSSLPVAHVRSVNMKKNKKKKEERKSRQDEKKGKEIERKIDQCKKQ